MLDGVKVVQYILVLEPLIGIVDTQLFEAVGLEALESKNIQKRDGTILICC